MNPKNGANNETEPVTVQNTENGGLSDNTCIPAKLPKIAMDPQTELREEVHFLRRMAAELACNAGAALSPREDYGVKDFDSYIGTWQKIVGVQVKLDGGGDGIEKLIGELADGDGNPDEI